MNPTTNVTATSPVATAPVATEPTEMTRIVEYTGGRDVFMELLKINPGVFIFKFGAEWCSPCKR